MITMRCKCGQSYRLKEAMAGKTGSCKKCGAEIAVPPTPTAADSLLVMRTQLARITLLLAVVVAAQVLPFLGLIVLAVLTSVAR